MPLPGDVGPLLIHGWAWSIWGWRSPVSGPDTSGAVLQQDGEAGGAAGQAAGDAEVDGARLGPVHDAPDAADEGGGDGVAGVDRGAVDRLAPPAVWIVVGRHHIVDRAALCDCLKGGFEGGLVDDDVDGWLGGGRRVGVAGGGEEDRIQRVPAALAGGACQFVGRHWVVGSESQPVAGFVDVGVELGVGVGVEDLAHRRPLGGPAFAAQRPAVADRLE